MAGTGDTTKKLPGGQDPLPVPPGFPAPGGAPGLLDPDSHRLTVLAPGRARSGPGAGPGSSGSGSGAGSGSSSGEPLPGALVPGYEVLRELARGGMGVVFEAWSQRHGRTAALKLLQPQLGLDPDSALRLAREIAAQARLDHPHVVRVLEAGQQAGQPWVAMELVAGESLEQRLRRGGPLAPAQAVAWTRALAGALQHAHQAGVLHRDLKPANVLIDPQDQPRLIDFGLALLAGDRERLTVTGMILGTPAYMAPEQASGERDAIDARSDVYGLGAVLYECLTGRPPYEGSSQLDILQAVVSRAPDPPSRHRPDLDPRLEALVLRCLAREPQQRFQSMARLEEALGIWEQRQTARAGWSALTLGVGAALLSMALALVSLLLPGGAPRTGAPAPTLPAPPGEGPLPAEAALQAAFALPPGCEQLLELAGAARACGLDERSSEAELRERVPDPERRGRLLWARHVEHCQRDLRELPSFSPALQQLLTDPGVSGPGATGHAWGRLARALNLLRSGRPADGRRELEPPAGAEPRVAAWLALLRAPLCHMDRALPDAGDEARRALDRALELDPELWLAGAMRALLELSAGDPDRARAALDACGASSAQAPLLLRALLANTLVVQGEDEEALHVLREVSRRDPTHVPAQLVRVRLLLHRSLPAPALDRIDALQVCPLSAQQRADAQLFRLQALLLADRWEEVLEAAAQLPAAHPEVLLCSTHALVLLGREREALDLLRRAREGPQRRKAEELAREVQARLEDLGRLAPPADATDNELLARLETRDDPQERLLILDALSALHPRDPRVFAERARERIRLRQFGACLRDMQRASELGGEPGEGEQATTAAALLALGRFDEAHRVLLPLSQAIPDDPALQLALARARLGLAELDQPVPSELARSAEQLRALEADPQAVWVRARILGELGRCADALALLRAHEPVSGDRARLARYLERRLQGS